MAAVLLASGAKGKRFALPHARVMLHQPVGGFEGQATDIEIHAREILEVKGTLEKILVDHTGQPADRIKADTDRDFFMSSQEAKKYGIVDQVIEKRKVKKTKR